jgi:hypothetical protein
MTYPAVAEEWKELIKGSIICGWGHGNEEHFPYTLPTMLGFYGDRLWDYTPAAYGDDFSVSLTRLILGPAAPENFDLFASLGGYSLPRNVREFLKEGQTFRYAHLDRITVSRETVEKAGEILHSLSASPCLAGKTAGIYEKCINWTLDKLEQV